MRGPHSGQCLLAYMRVIPYTSPLASSWPRQLSSLVEWASFHNRVGQQVSSSQQKACMMHQKQQQGPQLHQAQDSAIWRGISTSAPPSFASRDSSGSDPVTGAKHASSEDADTNTAASAGKEDDVDEDQKVKEIEDTHLTESMERLIMEAYKLLQQGEMQQAEQLLHEGSQALDEGVGVDNNHPCQAQLADQLSLFQFLQGKPADAEVNARRSLAIIQTHFPAGDPAICMCQLRLGSILFSMGRYQEAKDLITGSYKELNKAGVLVGESQYYLALLPLLAADSEETIAQADPMLMQGLRNMRSNAGAGPLLVQAALREHNRLVDVELTSENWDKAVWLFRQEIRLRNGVEPGSEDLCLLLYQFATLQYTRGEFAEAEALAQFSLDVSKSVYKLDENQIMLRRHRLGTIKDCTDKPEEADKLLSKSYQHFDRQLGPKNPLTGEAQFALALSGVRQMLHKSQSTDGLDPYTKVLAPQKKQDLLQKMQKGLQAMQAGFGADHMLVKKALADYDMTSTALRRV